MQTEYDDVRTFHERNGFPTEQALLADDPASNNILRSMFLALKSLGQSCLQPSMEAMDRGDPRLYRLHLMLEELAEVVEQLCEGNDVECAHENTDLLYVIFGNYVTFGWYPVEEMFAEVHRANMSKRKRVERDPRMRDKGDNFVPADIRSILSEAGVLSEDSSNAKA